MDDTSARLRLPLLAAGQAQKETTHNEALALIDLALQPAVLAVGVNMPPATPAPGAAWIVGDAPAAAWVGHARALAGWTDGGWRFVAPTQGMAAWDIASRVTMRFVDGAWTAPTVAAAIADPGGGATVDTKARGAISAMLAVLRGAGLIAP